MINRVDSGNKVGYLLPIVNSVCSGCILCLGRSNSNFYRTKAMARS
jgi:hypothetical protein